MIEAFSELDFDLCEPTQGNQNADEDIVSMDTSMNLSGCAFLRATAKVDLKN